MDYPSLEVVEMAVRNRMDELEEWCFWHRPQNPGTVALSHIGSVSSAPSPEFSDSLDSTITLSQYADGNYNNDEHNILDRQLLEETNDKCQIRRNECAEKVCSTHSPKTVSIDPNPRLLGTNQSMHKIKDFVLDNSPSRNYQERKSNDVRRVASSDSIPRNYNNVISSQGCRALSQDCVRRSKSSDVRSTVTPLRYIQSAKGTWTYNL